MLELVSTFRIEWLGAHSKKGASLPDVIRVPRPGDPERGKKRVSMREVVRQMLRG